MEMKTLWKTFLISESYHDAFVSVPQIYSAY